MAAALTGMLEKIFGKNLRERAEALIRIAHPDHQADLELAAKERKLLT